MCFEETLQPKAYRSLHARRQLRRDRGAAAAVGIGLDGRAQAVRWLFLRHFVAPAVNILTTSFTLCLSRPGTSALPIRNHLGVSRTSDRTALRQTRVLGPVCLSAC